MPGKQESPGAEDAAPTLPSVQPPCERLPCNKSSVCSRSYFVVVMVFFHIYIINVIALLLYVHYNSGQDEASGRGRDSPGGDHQRPAAGSPSPKPGVSLARIEGIRVSNLTHRSWFIILAPNLSGPSLHCRLDMSTRCPWCLEECMKCGP